MDERNDFYRQNQRNRRESTAMIIEVAHVEGDLFEAHVENFTYKVVLTDEYWQKLTGGKITKEALIKKSFEFLLGREGPESILSEFDLPTISRYFPEYEEIIR